MTMEIEKRQENWTSHYFYDTTASRVSALWTETSLSSLVFDEIDLTLCAILFSFTPALGAQAGRTVQTCPSQSGAVPTGTKGWASTLWKANRGGWCEAICQGTKQIWGTQVQGLPLACSPYCFCLDQMRVLLPANTVSKRFQTKGLGFIAKLPQRLNQSYYMLLFLIFMKKNAEINMLENSE